MARPFPTHPNLVGGYAPIQMECDAPDLIVEGEIPEDLNGTLYRIGPNPQFAPRGQYHWFGGDGMIHGFHLEQGRVSYLNRWVRTVKWKLENEAGESLFGIFNPMDNDPRVAGVKTDGIANTNIVWHGDKLLALVESNAPFEMDPQTLESIGSWTFDDKLKGAMTAHPKIDPETGEMLFFAYNADGNISPRMAFHVAARDGTLIRSEWFDAPYAAMVHDFITTRDHVIFPIMPLTGSMERAMQGGPVYAWEPEKRSYIGIMPRAGTVADIRWFEGDPAYVFHPMNARTVGQKVICEVCQYEEAPLFPHADGSKPDPKKSAAKLTRWTFDLASNTNTYKVEQLDDMRSEFPRLDERFTGLSYRHGYYACVVDGGAEGDRYNALGHIDFTSGSTKTYTAGNQFAISEPVFVPRGEKSAEGEGYLLATVYDASTDKSHLIILDAENIDSGPLARASLDHRVPFGFHGNWRGAQ
ncbi:MAG: carotenoid oxygenase family protein [Gammaproteobacteria bacterium]|nr:carotenoid oxygenase family protein [Gammaproteobacteria bacterium]MDD9896666.1 carotenoid oxygenase family protein [Gammaproteobacteria bacterium]MDD9957414.1 carotenoid oxygenase family protein [Gammaproteobacteria bacterium]